MPDECTPYIRRFGVLRARIKMQLCACSYGDDLVLGFSSKLVSTNIQRKLSKTVKGRGYFLQSVGERLSCAACGGQSR